MYAEMANEPYCLAMVLCDGVHMDPMTRKLTLLGTVSSFLVREFPSQIRLAIYFAITDGIGQVKIKIRIVDAQAGIADEDDSAQHKLVEMQTEIEFPTPLMIVETSIGLEFAIPKEGLYHCELLANDTLLMSRRFVAKGISKVEGQQ